MNKSDSFKKRTKDEDSKSKINEYNFSEENNQQLIEEIQKLTYEESFQALEVIVNSLQSDKITLDKMQSCFQLGNIYLRHCEQLLENLDQEIIEIDPDSL